MSVHRRKRGPIPTFVKASKTLVCILVGLSIAVAFDPITIAVMIAALCGGAAVFMKLLRGSDIRSWFASHRPSSWNPERLKILFKDRLQKGDVAVVPLYYDPVEDEIEDFEALEAEDADNEVRQMARAQVNILY